MPRERILPYIILGIVKHLPEPITGRIISQQFHNEIGEFWKASHSQIYPELKRMTADKWLSQTVTEENAKEKYYQLTPLGEQVLTDWLQEPVEEPPVQRDMFSLRMFFIHDQNDPRVLSLLEEERDLLAEQLLHFQTRQKLLFSEQAAIDNEFGHYLILSRAIARVSNQLEWIEDSISQYKQKS